MFQDNIIIVISHYNSLQITGFFSGRIRGSIARHPFHGRSGPDHSDPEEYFGFEQNRGQGARLRQQRIEGSDEHSQDLQLEEDERTLLFHW